MGDSCICDTLALLKHVPELGFHPQSTWWSRIHSENYCSTTPMKKLLAEHFIINWQTSQVRSFTPVIPILGRLWQEAIEWLAVLSYTGKACLKPTQNRWVWWYMLLTSALGRQGWENYHKVEASLVYRCPKTERATWWDPVPNKQTLC